jgi:hypothetical protein
MLLIRKLELLHEELKDATARIVQKMSKNDYIFVKIKILIFSVF